MNQTSSGLITTPTSARARARCKRVERTTSPAAPAASPSATPTTEICAAAREILARKLIDPAAAAALLLLLLLLGLLGLRRLLPLLATHSLRAPSLSRRRLPSRLPRRKRRRLPLHTSKHFFVCVVPNLAAATFLLPFVRFTHTVRHSTGFVNSAKFGHAVRDVHNNIATLETGRGSARPSRNAASR